MPHVRQCFHRDLTSLIQSILLTFLADKVRVIAHAAVHIDVAELVGIFLNGQQTAVLRTGLETCTAQPVSYLCQVFFL